MSLLLPVAPCSIHDVLCFKRTIRTSINSITSFHLCDNPVRLILEMYNSYETTQNKKSEPQNIEYRISNDEGWNRFAKSFLNQTEYIHSTFDVGRSMFDVHQFFFDYIGRLVGHPRRCLRTTDIKRSPLIRPNAAPSVHSFRIRIRLGSRWHLQP